MTPRSSYSQRTPSPAASPARRPRFAFAAAALLLGAALWGAAQDTTPTSLEDSSRSPLAARMEARLRDPALRASETGVEVLLLPQGRSLFSHNPHRLLRPASTIKILTGAASLALLGPEFTYHTDIIADAPIDSDGVLAGNLYVRGSGAPDLVGEAWWLMARRLAGLGLRRVSGDLVGDTSYFDTESRPPGWPPPSADSWYNAPVGALSCNFNVITLRITPAPRIGSPPSVALEPSTSFFEVVNRATTDRRSNSIEVRRRLENGRNTLTVSGSIRHGGKTVVVYRAVESPALYALHTFQEIASGEGIEIAGDLRLGTVPDGGHVLYRHPSKPLGELVRDMNKNSNNFMSEALLKTVAAERVGVPGTTENGVRMIGDFLSGIGLNPSANRIVDGSGLSRENRLSARFLAQVLAHIHRDFAIGPEMVASLSVGGTDGTLDARFANDDGMRRVRAKTGRIEGAITLAGYASNRDGSVIAFAILANRPRGTIESVHRAIDALVEAAVSSTNDELTP